jgi:hypothetical protein
MSAQPEQWRVSTIEGVFETDLETLKQWIIEGCVLPTDKVSKGTLSWIDAGRVPKLKGAFNGEIETTAPPQPTVTSTQGGWQTPPVVDDQQHFEPQTFSSTTSTTNAAMSSAPANSCHNHPGVPPNYICRQCEALLCDECPRFIGNSKIPVCPLCGDLCRSYAEVRTKVKRAQFQSSGFGMSDFLRAVTYPFQHKAALLGGALLYGFLLLAGLRGSVVAWMIMFGCISHVINQVAWGRLDRSFMPDFSAFSLWDDLVVPIFLGLGITIVSWGPTIALLVVLIFGVVSSGGVSPLSAVGQMQAQQHEGLTSEDLGTLTDPNADPKKLEEANRKLQATRPGSQIAKGAERSKEEQSDPAGVFRMLVPYLGAGIALVLLLLVTIVWGIFYYPMALTVAGYTQSFGSVVNPLVGLDTIRRMGATYFKAFGMVIAIQIVALVVGGIVAMILSPFALPFVGNLPANFINGSITFYFNLVIACVLGLSLYKCADRLGISVD